MATVMDPRACVVGEAKALALVSVCAVQVRLGETLRGVAPNLRLTVLAALPNILAIARND